jgi:hypothetical protein
VYICDRKEAKWREVFFDLEIKKVKVKVTLKSHKRLEGSRGIALLFLNLGTRWGWVVNVTPRPLYPRERPGTNV